MQHHKESGALIIYINDKPSGIINSPWAKDIHGNNLETYFDIKGNEVTQYVVPPTDEASYPLLADPRVNWGIVSGHVYFSKEETRYMTGGAAAVMGVSPFWAIIPPPLGP